MTRKEKHMYIISHSPFWTKTHRVRAEEMNILNWHLPLLHWFALRNRLGSVPGTSCYHYLLEAVVESSDICGQSTPRPVCTSKLDWEAPPFANHNRIRTRSSGVWSTSNCILSISPPPPPHTSMDLLLAEYGCRCIGYVARLAIRTHVYREAPDQPAHLHNMTRELHCPLFNKWDPLLQNNG